ncbi:MAG: 2-oxoglutarate dehydrogenase complex dihydrolipoyllysine-residue succinyltransferase [Alphaproteobacteria bacterium]|nr:2-oxoglutarate dehydrogenase complex dihydrolipoyllysine-residue succinyltransferase [Alphaproteobacteria bacterium]
MAVEIVVPVLGESVTEATIARWIKQSGDAVKADEPIVELETDKVTVEVPAPASGVLGDLKVAEGDNVEVGALLASIDESGTPAPAKAAPKAEAAKAEPAKAPAPAAAAPKPAPAAPAVVPQPAVSMSPAALAAGAPPMPPSVKKLVAENGLDPNAIPASGRGGRLTKADVLDFLASGGKDVFALAEPEADRSEERVKMSRLRRRIAERLKEAQNTAAMLTTFNEVDMTAILAARKEYKDDFEKRHDVRLGFMSFFVKAAIQGLRDVPAVNAQIDGDEVVYKNYYDVGVAVGTENGLVVPIIRNAETLSLAGIEKAIGGFAKKARDGKLSMADMSGGTFTISNGGVYGSLMSTPILNPPQSGILGMHKTQMRPMVMPDGSIEARPMMYLALSYDHRIVDGSEAVTCLVRMKESLEDPRRLLLDM